LGIFKPLKMAQSFMAPGGRLDVNGPPAGPSIFIATPPQSSTDLFKNIASVKQQKGLPLSLVGLGQTKTEVKPDGTVLLKFEDGKSLALDEFVIEARAQGLLKERAFIRVGVDCRAANSEGVDPIAPANAIAKKHNVVIDFFQAPPRPPFF
jgi:hypothetical protein